MRQSDHRTAVNTPGELVCMTLHSFHIGGCELQLLSLCESLKEYNVPVIILHSFVSGGLKFPSIKNFKFFYIPPFFYKFRLIPFYLSYLFRWKIKQYPTIFHCHSICYFTEQILWFAHRQKIPALVKITTDGHISSLKERIEQRPNFPRFLREMFSKKPFAQKRSLLENFVFGRKRFKTYSKVSGFLTINTHIGMELEKFPIEKRQIIFLPNAVDPHRFYPVSESEKWNLKKDLNLPTDMKYIITVARFVKRKRIQDLILAWSKIADCFPNHMLLLVGDGPEKIEYENLTSQLEIQNRILFTGFQLKIEKIFQLSDLFAFPSEREGLPNVLLEAMSSQLPIVASAISGIHEILDPFQNGLLFPAGNVEALTESLLYLLNQPKEAQRMAVAAREKILRLYSFKVTTPKFVSIYRKHQLQNSPTYIERGPERIKNG